MSLRLLAFLIAVAAIAIALGAAAGIGLTGTFIVVLAAGDALGALLIADIAVRRTRHR